MHHNRPFRGFSKFLFRQRNENPTSQLELKSKSQLIKLQASIMAKTNETPRLICCFVLFNPPPPLQCWLAKLKHEMMVFFAIDKLTQRNYSQCNINIVRGKGGGLYCF